MGQSKEWFMEQREYDDINSEHQGFEQEEEHIPMSEQQRNQLYKLIENAVLTDEQKETYHLFVDRSMSYLEAETLKQELKEIQLDPINMARAGKLTQADLGKALARLVKMSNT